MEEKQVMKIPHSDEAERYILGCMLIDQSIIDQTISEISSEDFYSRPNKNVMLAIETLVKNNTIVDYTTVLDELKRLNLLKATGGNDYLYALMESVPTVANIEAYLTILHDKSLERKLYEVVNQIASNILKGDDNLTDLLAKSEKSFSDVINRQKVSDFKRIDLLTDSVISIIEENKNKDGN